MTRPILYTLVVLSAGFCIVPFAMKGQLLFALAGLVLGILWIIGLLRGWKWTPALAVFGINALAVVTMLLGPSSRLAIPSAFLALLGWDLSDLHFRLRLAAKGDDIAGIERRHLLVLGLVGLAGVIAMVFALQVHIPVAFEWVGVLLLFGIWGIGRIVRGLLKRERVEE
jgi:hypothetical protein